MSPGWGFSDLKRQREEGVQSLRRALAAKPPEAKALTGFLVYGPPTPKLLFTIAGRLPREDAEERGHMAQAGKDVYLVFYSHPSSYYLRLKHV